MADANAHYYATRDPLGAAGDFLTSPEISQMFGELVGAWLANLWQRAGSPDLCHYFRRVCRNYDLLVTTADIPHESALQVCMHVHVRLV